MPPLRGGKSFVTMSTFGIAGHLTQASGLPGPSPKNEAGPLGPDRCVELGPVPASDGDLLHILARQGRVDEVSAADIYPDVRIARETEYVAGMQVSGGERARPGMQRHRGQRSNLVVAHPRNRNARVPPRRHREPGAVIALVAWPGAAVDIRAVELAVREGDRLLSLGRRRPVVVTTATATRPRSLPLRGRQLCEQRLLLLLQVVEHEDPLFHGTLQPQDPGPGALRGQLRVKQAAACRPVLVDLGGIGD